MGKGTFAADVGFAAENDPIAGGKVIKEHRFLAARALDEGGHSGDEFGEFALVRLEIGVDADGGMG